MRSGAPSCGQQRPHPAVPPRALPLGIGYGRATGVAAASRRRLRSLVRHHLVALRGGIGCAAGAGATPRSSASTSTAPVVRAATSCGVLAPPAGSPPLGLYSDTLETELLAAHCAAARCWS